MFQTTRYGSSKTVHLTTTGTDGNTWPICGAKRHLQVWGSLPETVDHEATCKQCLKKSA